MAVVNRSRIHNGWKPFLQFKAQGLQSLGLSRSQVLPDDAFGNVSGTALTYSPKYLSFNLT
jgi:hypothetical protein